MATADTATIKAKDAVPGRWYRDRGTIVLYINFVEREHWFANKELGISAVPEDRDIKPIPDCTGWDWEPTPKPNSTIEVGDQVMVNSPGHRYDGDIGTVDVHGEICTVAFKDGGESSIHRTRLIRQDHIAPKHPPIPDPGEGWRLLSPEERTLEGDEYFDGDWFKSTNWRLANGVQGKGSFGKRLFYRRRIEPRYRPFANAAEFAPNRDRWMVNIGTGTIRRVDHYSDRGVNGVDWETARRKWTFDDGNPFGVKVE